MNKVVSKIHLLFLSLIVILFPFTVHAANIFVLQESNFKGVICYIIGLIKIVNPILFFLAFILFFWGLTKFIINSPGEKELKVGKNYMLWGIIALFVLVTFQAIIGIITNEFGFGNGIKTGYPFLPSTNTEVCGLTPMINSNVINYVDPETGKFNP